jgi:hypothetical protein
MLLTVVTSVVLSMIWSLGFVLWYLQIERDRMNARIRALENRVDLPEVMRDLEHGVGDWAWPERD